MLNLALQPYLRAVCTDKWVIYKSPFFKGSDFLPFNWSSSYEKGVTGTRYFVKQLLQFPFYWASLCNTHSQPFIWPECYEDQVFERTFPLLKSLAIIIAISLTAFLPWVRDDTVSPTASQFDMSQFPGYFHTVDVTDITSCSRTVFTWRKIFWSSGSENFLFLFRNQYIY